MTYIHFIFLLEQDDLIYFEILILHAILLNIFLNSLQVLPAVVHNHKYICRLQDCHCLKGNKLHKPRRDCISFVFLLVSFFDSLLLALPRNSSARYDERREEDFSEPSFFSLSLSSKFRAWIWRELG